MIGHWSLTASAPAQTQLTSVERFVAEYGQVAADGVINDYIDAASDELVSTLRFPDARGPASHALALTDYQFSLRLTGPCREIWLPRYWLTADPLVAEDGVALDPDEIEADLSRGVIRRLLNGAEACFTPCDVSVTFSAGFALPGASAPTLPAAIERACRDLIVHRRIAAGDDAFDPPVKSDAFPGVGTLTYAVAAPALDGAMPAHISALMKPYRYNLFRHGAFLG